jgi:hypothetical protein
MFQTVIVLGGLIGLCVFMGELAAKRARILSALRREDA